VRIVRSSRPSLEEVEASGCSSRSLHFLLLCLLLYSFHQALQSPLKTMATSHERERTQRSSSISPSVELVQARELSRSQYLVGTAMLLAVVVMWISVRLLSFSPYKASADRLLLSERTRRRLSS
jgi:hypothetical protein